MKHKIDVTIPTGYEIRSFECPICMSQAEKINKVRTIPESEQMDFIIKRRAMGYTQKEIALLYGEVYKRKMKQETVSRLLRKDRGES